jgi:hypothetical protein
MNKFIAAVVVAVVAAGGAYLIASGGSDSVPESESDQVQFESYEGSQAQKPTPSATDEPSAKRQEPPEAEKPKEAPTEVEVVRMDRDQKSESADSGTNTAKPGDGSPEFSRPTVNPEDLKAIQVPDNLKIREIEIDQQRIDNLEFRSIQRDQNNEQRND